MLLIRREEGIEL